LIRNNFIIKKSKIRFIILIIESLILLSFIGVLLYQSFKVYNGLNYIENMQTAQVYTNRYNFNELEKYDKKYQFNDDELTKKNKELFLYIENNFNEKYFLWSYDIYKYDSAGNAIPTGVNVVSTNKFFFIFYNIKASSGDINDLNDTKSEIIPIAIGYNLSDRYKLNEVFTMENQNTGTKNQKYKVVAILSKNSKYPSFDFVGEYYYLDNSMINIIRDDTDLNSSTLYMALSNIYLVTNDKTKLNKINVEAKKLDIAQLNFQTIGTTVGQDLQYIKDGMIANLIILIVTILIVIISFSIIIYNTIKKSIKEFIVKYYCGASYQNIKAEIYITLVIIFLIGLIPSLFLFIFTKTSILALIFELIFIIILVFIIANVIIKIVSRNNLIEIYRKEN
jgi:hypothetical protein